MWIAAGANAKEVATRAGHSSVSFTFDRYGHLYPDADQVLSDRLGAMFSVPEKAAEAEILPIRQT